MKLTRNDEMVGNRYGRLVVTEIVITPPGQKNKCRCKCDCGNIVDVIPYNLKRNGRSTRSCGCLYRESRKHIAKTHGMSNTRIYHIWNTMRARCNRPTDKNYKWYGGDGVIVCDEWKNFAAFYEWAMANGYRDDLTIDRINNSGNYCPENCRWATMTEQQNNRRNNHRITYNGETHTIAEWSRILGINPHTVSHRINAAGLSEWEALTKEVRR